jgi:hypothetical protein
VTKRLLNLGIAFAFLLGGWCNVISAGLCVHKGCEISVAGQPGRAHSEHAADDSADDAAMDMGHGAQHADHSAHQKTHQDAHVEGREYIQASTASAPFHPCAYCMGQPQLPGKIEQGRKTIPSGGKNAFLSDGPGQTHFVAPFVVFNRAVTPSQHAPPSVERLHLLNQVFLI